MTPVVPAHTYMRERDNRYIYARERQHIHTCTHNSRRHPLDHEEGRERGRESEERERRARANRAAKRREQLKSSVSRPLVKRSSRDKSSE
jgi:hypothetical protein